MSAGQQVSLHGNRPKTFTGQQDAVLTLLLAHRGKWVPAYRLAAIALQNSARIKELRDAGYLIENRTERVGLVQSKAADDFVFTRTSGKPVRDFGVMWQNVCAHAGVPELLFHDLRRTGARNLRRAGVAEGIIMKIGGWRTRSVFERYAIVSRSDMNDAILKLQESEKRAEQEALAAEEQARAQSGHNEAVSAQPTASRAVN